MERILYTLEELRERLIIIGRKLDLLAQKIDALEGKND